MARFPFSKGRKKASPQLVLAIEPMSKAHKILGSLPINIDSPQHWDDASSAFSAASADSTLTSLTSTESDLSDHHVAIASAQDECPNVPHLLPVILESNTLDKDNDLDPTDLAHGLREIHSSSTFTSRHDMSHKHKPLPATPQTSVMSNTNAMPPKIHKMLELDGSPPKKITNKPPSRDSNTSRHTHRLLHKGLSNQSRPPVMPLMAPIGKLSRKVQKANSNNCLFFPASQESRRPHILGDGRRGGSSFRNIPSLYDHYEQMTLWHMMQQEAQEKEEIEKQQTDPTKDVDTGTDASKHLGPVQDVLGLRGSLPMTPPQTASTMTDLSCTTATTTSHPSSKSTASDSTSDPRRLDLQKTSILMLSSDSEDEVGKEKPTPRPRRQQTKNPPHRPSAASLSPRTDSLTQSKKTLIRGSDHRSLPNLKQTSFLSTDSYMASSNSKRLTTDTTIVNGIDSRWSTSHGTDHASCRTSLLSSTSSASALQHGSNYIQEARVVPMMAGRRPCCVEYGDQNRATHAPPSTKSLPPIPPIPQRHPSVVSISPEQITPPLSPTSVDFYIQPAPSALASHPSTDGPSSQSRYMAVTRHEEMLLSALRHKKLSQKKKPLDVAQEPSRQPKEEDSITMEGGEEGGLGDTDLAVAEAMFDFGFPVPPTSRKQSLLSDAMTASASASGGASTATKVEMPKKSIRQDGSNALGSLQHHSPAASPRLKSILKKPSRFPDGETEQQQVMLCLNRFQDTQPVDFAEPSPDLTDFSEFRYLTMASLLNEGSEYHIQPNSPRFGAPTQLLPPLPPLAVQRKRMDRGYRSPIAMASVPEDGEVGNDLDEDIPRPDSPISPDSFPAVPRFRTTLRATLSDKARLSAVGSAPAMSGPGWWGDDD